MTKLKSTYVSLILLFMCHGVDAQVFAGFDSFCGLPVIVGQDSQHASARTDQYGNKFIHVDPSVMGNWSMSRMFVLAHECAHHLLGHTSHLGNLERYHGGTAKQELEADCWAAKALRRVGHGQEITRTILERYSEGHFSANGYPSGYQRAQNIGECANGQEASCRVIRVPETYMDVEYVMQPTQVPCQHCGCDYYGRCGCLHQFDVVPQRVEVPVRRTRYISREVCD